MNAKIVLSLSAVAFTAATSFADTWSSVPQAGADTTPTAPVTSPQAGTMSQGAAQMLLQEVDQLRQEVQRLQGLVDQQQFEINKIKVEQKERYLDLDRRLSAKVASPAGMASSGGSSPKDQYAAAFDLMKNQKLDEATQAFKGFLDGYPQHDLSVNAYYWMGQIFYNQANLDEARKAFTIVVNQYPKHQKAADSSYKLGVVLHRLGDTTKAKQLLKGVVKNHPNSATARLASKYLKENF